jgi:hypothetical protein
MTFLADAPPKLTEAQFMAQVIRLAEVFGWRHYHTRDSRRSPEGFPDLVLLRRPRVVFCELKSDRGALTPAQRAWLEELRACGQEAYVFKPRDMDAIAKLLR